MKRILFIILCTGLLLSSNNLCAQQSSGGDKDYKFTLKTNPLAALGGPFWVVVVPVTGEYKLWAETAVSAKSSLQLGVSYLGPSILINLDELIKNESGDVSGVKTSGFRLQGIYKLFISRDLKAPEGFYLGPHVSYATAAIKSKDDPNDKISGTKLNINGVIGYQMITSGGFTLDIFTGMGFISRKYTVSGTTFDENEFKTKNSVSIPFGVSFGYGF